MNQPSPGFITPRARVTALLSLTSLLGGFLLAFTSQQVSVSLSHPTNRSPARAETREASGPTHSIGPVTPDAEAERRLRLLATYLAAASHTETPAQRRHLRAVLHQLRPVDFPFLATAITQRPAEIPLLLPLFVQWAKVAPEEAAAHLLQHRQALGEEGTRCLAQFARAWSEQHPTAARSWAAHWPDAAQRPHAISGVLAGMGDTEPQAALQWLDSLPPMVNAPDPGPLFLRWAAHDPATAVQTLWSRREQQALPSETGDILRIWAVRDPAAAVAWGERIMEEQRAVRMMEGEAVEMENEPDVTYEPLTWRNIFWQGWVAIDPEAALAAGRRHPDPKQRTDVLHRVLTRYASTAPAAAERLLGECSPGEAKDNALKAMIGGAWYSEPERACRWALQLDSDKFLPQQARYALWHWWKQDRSAAEAFAKGRPSMERELGFSEIMDIDNQASVDPQQTIAKFEDYPHLRSAYWTAVNKWAETEPTAALAWMDQHLLNPHAIPSVSLTKLDITHPYRRFLKDLSERHPLLAAQRVAALAEDEADEDTILAVAEAMAVRQVQQAQTWADTLPPGHRPHAYLKLGAQWARQEPAATASWLEQIPAGRERDAALRGVAGATMEIDPVAAAHWIEQIADPDLRSEEAEMHLSDWEDIDPAAAAAWRSKMGLKEEE